MLENIEGLIQKDNPEKQATYGTQDTEQINVGEYRRGNKKGKSRETGNIGCTRSRQTKQKHNTICVGHYYAQADTHYVGKTCALLQTTGGKDEPSFVFFCRNRNGHDNNVATCN